MYALNTLARQTQTSQSGRAPDSSLHPLLLCSPSQVLLATLEETPVAAKVLVPLRTGLNGVEAAGKLTERQLEKFHRECSLLASVRHPNIVQVCGRLLLCCCNTVLLSCAAVAVHAPMPPAHALACRRATVPELHEIPTSAPAALQILCVCEDPPTIVMGEQRLRCCGGRHSMWVPLLPIALAQVADSQSGCIPVLPSPSARLRALSNAIHLRLPLTKCSTCRVLQQRQPAGRAEGGARVSPARSHAELAAPPQHGARCSQGHPVSLSSAAESACRWNSAGAESRPASGSA